MQDFTCHVTFLFSNGFCRGWWTPMFMTAGLTSATQFLKHFSRQNTLTKARRNISRHYDLVSCLMLTSFLSHEVGFLIYFITWYFYRAMSFLLYSWMIPWVIPLRYSRWQWDFLTLLFFYFCSYVILLRI